MKNQKTMNYPLISEYIEAIKSAEDNFKELTNLQPVIGDDEQPVMTSGNFSVVFKMKDKRDGKLYAVKCFTKEQEGRAENYKLIADELEYVSSNYLTPIKYLEKELFVDTDQTEETEFPVLLMDWVEGKILDVYIKEHSEEKYILEMLTFQFCKLASWLLSQPFAHGDLKPDNILVKMDGKIVLVDYDGMYVPAMKGQKAKELGSPDFRHPLRTEDDFNERIDDFSLSCIALSLKAISIDSSLLLVSKSNNGLLFSEKDFQNIGNSPMIELLNSLSDEIDYLRLLGVFYVCYANKEFSDISFKLFDAVKPNKEIEQFIYGSFTDYRDGYTYKTIKIGNQTWLAENLRYLPSINSGYYVYGYNGNDISEAKRTQNYNSFGVLYDMNSAIEACPKGWHIPSDDEWNDLELQLGLLDNDEERIVKVDDIYYHFKGHHGSTMINKSLWKDGILKQISIKDGTFNAVPAGWRTYHGYMEDASILSRWWTGTRDMSEKRNFYYYRALYYKDDGVQRDSCHNSCCLSLRCIKGDKSVTIKKIDNDIDDIPF